MEIKRPTAYEKNISYLRARDPSILTCGLPLNTGKKLQDQFAETSSYTRIYELQEDPEDNNHIQVYLRLKMIDKYKELYDIVGNSLVCKIPEGAQCIRNIREGTTVTKTFAFSKIFDPESTQTELFNSIVKAKLLNFINGFNCTLMTYGASGSGKTYTIVGTTNEPGIIPQALEYIFRSLPKLPQEPLIKPGSSNTIIKLDELQRKAEKARSTNLLNNPGNPVSHADRIQHIRIYRSMQQRLSSEPVATVSTDDDVMLSVWVSFAEIYNEYVYDLLTPHPVRGQSRQKLRLGSCNNNTYIKDLTYVCVTSGLEAFQLLQYGLQNLKYAATSINDHSSRSHSIFTIKLAQASDTKEGVSISSFNFCDLAGSERLKKTHNAGDRLIESNNINTSLMILGRCISCIRESQKNNAAMKSIPFRESKLTQLFQKALSGCEAISMIVTVSPTREMFDESQHVLNFSAIAKDITIQQKSQITRPLSKFSQCVGGRSTSVPAVSEVNEELILRNEELEKVIDILHDKLIQEREEAQGHREHVISEYDKLLDQTKQFWIKRNKELEKEMAKYKDFYMQHSDQQTKKRKLSVVVIDSSSDEENDEKQNKQKQCHYCKDLEMKLSQAQITLQQKENEILKLTEEIKSSQEVNMHYEASNIALEKTILQQQDEIAALLPYRENFSTYVSTDVIDDQMPHGMAQIQESNKDIENYEKMESNENENNEFSLMPTNTNIEKINDQEIDSNQETNTAHTPLIVKEDNENASGNTDAIMKPRERHNHISDTILQEKNTTIPEKIETGQSEIFKHFSSHTHVRGMSEEYKENERNLFDDSFP